MLVTTKDGEEIELVCEKHEGDTSGEYILSGFGSSSGSSTDETSDQEEFIAELTRQMAENMLQEDDEKLPSSLVASTNKPKPSRFQPTHVVQNNQKYKHQNQQQRKMKENGDCSKRGGFLSSNLRNGSGMKLVFLGETGSKNGSSGGTGVFIPHATNNLPPYHQPRKKPGRCPTVLIPERVLQTLQQHFEKRNASQNQRLQLQETSNKTVANNDSIINQELQLPQEWTY